jgi:K+-dependent Na+/Ca+ exchanger-like protein
MVIIGSLLVIMASVYVLAIITEEYFIISLDKLSTRMEIPSDVAGASLMAMGSSAPEICIALIAVFIGGSHGEVGIGTIVGSAVFNILVITGASALVAGQLAMNIESVQRDIAFYIISILLLLFVFWNGEILIWESILLLVAYVVYLVVLWRWGDTHPSPREHPKRHPIKQDETQKSLLSRFNRLLVRVFGFVARDPEEDYIWSMVVSIAGIAILSYILVEAALALSAAINLPPVIVSLTVLAAGTSAPDLISSISVAEEGRGNMAIANAVGSNIFDILVGLGLPWLLILLLGDPQLFVSTDGLISSIIVLTVTVLLLYYFLYSNSTFTRRDGIILIIVYVVYIAYAILTA